MAATVAPLSALTQWTGTEAVGDLAWSPSGASWAFSTLQGEILVFRAGQPPPLTLSGHANGTFALLWWNETTLVSGGADGTVRLWNTSTGTAQDTTLESKSLWVENLALSPDRHLLAVGAGPSLTLWNEKMEKVRAYPRRASSVADLQWHPRGKCLASVANAEVCCWRAGSDKPVDRFTYASSLLIGRWSPRGDWFVTGCQDATLHLWMTATGEDLYMAGFERKVRELDFHPYGRWLAVGGSPEITLWDFSGEGPAGTTPHRLIGHQGFVTRLTFSPDGKLLASGGEDGRVLLWAAEGAHFPLAGYQLEGPVTHAAWKPDGRALLAGGENGEAVVLQTP